MDTPSFPPPRPRIRFRPIAPQTDIPAEYAEAGGERPRLVADPPGKKKGRKREPNKGSFSAGMSGNPKGRPPGAKGAKATIRKALNGSVDVQTAKGRKKIGIFDALIKKEIVLAVDGDWRARRTMFELARWALGDSSEGPQLLGAVAPDELTDAGRVIIDWFADEIRARDNATDDQGDQP
jgi:hypothetical protein